MMVNVNSQYQRAVHQHQQSHSFIDTTQRSYIPPFIMTSIKRSNAVTLHPSSLCDDDIEAALKTNLLAKNEKDISGADAEYDSDDEEEDVSISIQCHVPVSMLQYSAHDLSFSRSTVHFRTSICHSQ
jgi:hypothetical protein